jgi:hypothetical protein
MAVERCVVGLAGQSGVGHIVPVEAESVFEAATRALAKFQRHLWLKSELTLGTVLVVEVPSRSREYRVEVRRLLSWFDGSGGNRMRRFQLKRLLEKPQDSPRINARIRAH